MDYVTLGRTGLRVSVLGLGGGGHSRLGQRSGVATDQSVALVRRAFELGVNFVDTAEAYGTEEIVGEALGSVVRDEVVVSTKKSMSADQDRLISADELAAGLERSLRRLRTDYVDIYHLHGVRAHQYEHAVQELVPALQRLRDQGKIRFLGITEAFASDPGHEMMSRAVQDPYWDVVMVGFNILNQSARQRVFPHTRRCGIGVLCMFAVRDALSQPTKLREMVAKLIEERLIDRDAVDLNDPLGFVLRRGDAQSLPEAAYRFCRAEEGIDVVLSGTGNIQHLEENIKAILQPALPSDTHARLMNIFERVDSVSGQ